MKTWLSADHHLGHANIIKYCNRPFSDVREMDNELCSTWNSFVAPDDEVYYLGDLTLGDGKLASYYFNRLNGKFTVLGNPWHHDRKWLEGITIPGVSGFSSHSSYMPIIELPILVIDSDILNGDGYEVPIILCHYPFEVWDRKHYGAFHFHGHSHGVLPTMHNRLDVGIDNAYKLVGDYRPLELSEACKFASLIK